MTELIERMPEGAGWWVGAAIVILLFGAPAIASKETAKSKLWLFGAVARWIQERKKRSIESEQQLRKTQAGFLREEITELRGYIKEDRATHSHEIAQMREAHSTQIAELRADLDQERRLRRRIETKLQSMMDEMWDYIEWTTAWARQVLVAAQEHGWRPPLPEWLSFHEWRERNARNPPD